MPKTNALYSPIPEERSLDAVLEVLSNGRIFLARLAGPMQGPAEFKPIVLRTAHGPALIAFSQEAIAADAHGCQEWAADNSTVGNPEWVNTVSVGNADSFLMWTYVALLKEPSLQWVALDPTRPDAASVGLQGQERSYQMPVIPLARLTSRRQLRAALQQVGMDVAQLERVAGHAPMAAEGCFGAASPVLTERGTTVPIGGVSPGMRVMSLDTTGKHTPGKVLRVHVYPPRALWELKTEGGPRLEVTGSHLFLCGDGRWRCTRDLQIGMYLHGVYGPVRIERVEPLEYKAAVYNLILEGGRPYVVARCTVSSFERLPEIRRRLAALTGLSSEDLLSAASNVSGRLLEATRAPAFGWSSGSR